MLKLTLMSLVVGAATLVPPCAYADKRVALVVGNAAYRNTPALANPVNDAEEMSAALRRIGFDVILERNLSKQGMEGAIARFARLAQDADAALFFYAGHGMQYRGSNYLVPIDAKLEDEYSLNFELTRIDDVLFGLERARGVKILILDACRNNPLAERLSRSAATRDLMITRGLAKIEPTRGMVISYSTQANQVAVDGDGRNSPFTAALVKYLDEPGLEIGALFRRVAADVDRATGSRQLPELSVSLLGEFYLNTRETDVQAWTKARDSNDAALLRDFLRRYPASGLVADARARLAAIEQDRPGYPRHPDQTTAPAPPASSATNAAPDVAAPAEPSLPKVLPAPEGRPREGSSKSAALPKDNAAPKPKEAAGFDGRWTIHWNGPSCLAATSGSYTITVAKGSIVGGQSAGSISSSGAARWTRTNPLGQTVDVHGTFRGNSGSGRFAAPMGCRGTWTARRS
jgi:hypothetical protein